MVEDVAEMGLGADLSAAECEAADGVAVTERPVDNVEVVDVLLDDVVAGEPGKVEPVADLPFDIGHVATFAMPEAALVPVASCGGDGADGAVLDALHRF